MRDSVPIALTVMALIVGCGKSDDESPTPPAQPVPVPQAGTESTPNTAAPNPNDLQNASVQNTVLTTQLPSPALPDGATSAAAGAAGSAEKALGDAQSRANAAFGNASASVEAQAKDLIAKARDYIQQNQLVDADKLVVQLEQMKAKLPEELQKQIGDVRTLLDRAKANLGTMDLNK
jgi:hypothetical protein